MTFNDQENSKTRNRILNAACSLFAARGFHDTTIRDICQEAGVNVAGVNYHFGSKERLYEDVCKSLFGNYEKDSDMLFNLGPGDLPAEERLKVFIKKLLSAVLSQERSDLKEKIMSREMMKPSGILPVIVEDIIRPRYRQLFAIVEDLLPGSEDEGVVRMCCLSIVGQCMYYRFAQPVILQLYPMQSYDESGIEEIAEHIYRFSLCAIRNINSTGKEAS